MYRDARQAELENLAAERRQRPRSTDLSIGQGIKADSILKWVDVNGAYAKLSKALLLIAGKSRLRDCSEAELEAIEDAIKRTMAHHDHRICHDCRFVCKAS